MEEKVVRGYAETVVTYDRNGQPKGSSNIFYRLNAGEYKAVNLIGECWKLWYDKKNKKRADAAVERMI